MRILSNANVLCILRFLNSGWQECELPLVLCILQELFSGGSFSNPHMCRIYSQRLKYLLEGLQNLLSYLLPPFRYSVLQILATLVSLNPNLCLRNSTPQPDDPTGSLMIFLPVPSLGKCLSGTTVLFHALDTVWLLAIYDRRTTPLVGTSSWAKEEVPIIILLNEIYVFIGKNTKFKIKF